MGTIDFSSGMADTYISQVREMEAGGPQGRKNIRHRPPINRAEAQMAKEVRRRVDRRVIGYRGEPSPHRVRLITAAGHCAKCGRVFDALAEGILWRQVYDQWGRTDMYACRGGCPREAS